MMGAVTSSLLFRHPWLTAALLYLPMALIFAAHLWLTPEGLWPTGFVQYEHIGYMAMAREHFDGSSFALLFSLPFSSDYDSPHIYFQPHTLALGSLVHFTGWDPGRTYLAFGVVAGFIMVRLVIALYGRAIPHRNWIAGVGLVACVWGGGLLFAAGVVKSVLEGNFTLPSYFQFDAKFELWFVNVGRNLYFPNEAYFHCLTFSLLLLLMNHRLAIASVVLLFISMSHPFTGIQFILISLSWSVLEFIYKRERIYLYFTLYSTMMLSLHIYYYMFALPRLSADHQALVTQWELDLSFTLGGLLLAYGLVVPIAVLAVARGGLRSSQTRLLLCMALVSLALANHQLLIAPRQPLHFTRGYIWLPLFLLAARLAIDWLSRLAHRRLIVASVLALFLVDNAAWVAVQLRNNLIGLSYAIVFTPARKAVLDHLSADEYSGYLLVSDIHLLPYQATAYTSLRGWYTHLASTPRASQRWSEIEAWASTGEEPAEWRRRPVLFVIEDRGRDPTTFPWVTPESRIERVEEGAEAYLLVRRPPVN